VLGGRRLDNPWLLGRRLNGFQAYMHSRNGTNLTPAGITRAGLLRLRYHQISASDFAEQAAEAEPRLSGYRPERFCNLLNLVASRFSVQEEPRCAVACSCGFSVYLSHSVFETVGMSGTGKPASAFGYGWRTEFSRTPRQRLYRV
jgi:hypothetical protein